jgi:exosome complex component RRP4
MERERMEKEKTEEINEEEHKHIKREVVVPGEVIGTGADLLPGEGTRREGKEIISMKFGLLEQIDKLIKVIPLGGVYIPRRGNIIIGQVVDITFNGWLLDINAPNVGFLPVTECFGRIRDPAEHFTFGDILVTEVKAVKSRGIDVSMYERGLERLEGGIIIRISPTRVPRIIGKKGSMINEIKQETGCAIEVGQNGVIWIRGKNVDEEMLAKEAIEMISEKPFITGLTEKVQEFLKDRKSKK